MTPGDIFKAKYLGTKKKFRLLGPKDTITSNCIQKWIFEEQPLCYDEVIREFENELSMRGNDLSNMGFRKTCLPGDTVSDEHTHRIYLDVILN